MTTHFDSRPTARMMDLLTLPGRLSLISFVCFFKCQTAGADASDSTWCDAHQCEPDSSLLPLAVKLLLLTICLQGTPCGQSVCRLLMSRFSAELMLLYVLSRVLATTCCTRCVSRMQGISIAVWNDLGTLECPALPLECPYQSGQAVLKWLNFDTSEKWPSLVYLAILCIGFRLSALGVMSIKAKRNMAGGY